MDDYGSGSWNGTPVRDKNGRNGVVIDDQNGPFWRYLDIKFEDGELHTLKLDNTPAARHENPLEIEWEFSPKEYPGKWSKIGRLPA